jgi:hypothetical protein
MWVSVTHRQWLIYRWGWGFSTSQDFNGDIALIACFAASWTPALVRRWHADPFGFLRPWNHGTSTRSSISAHRRLTRLFEMATRGTPHRPPRSVLGASRASTLRVEMPCT